MCGKSTSVIFGSMGNKSEIVISKTVPSIALYIYSLFFLRRAQGSQVFLLFARHTRVWEILAPGYMIEERTFFPKTKTYVAKHLKTRELQCFFVRCHLCIFLTTPEWVYFIHSFKPCNHHILPNDATKKPKEGGASENKASKKMHFCSPQGSLSRKSASVHRKLSLSHSNSNRVWSIYFHYERGKRFIFR